MQNQLTKQFIAICEQITILKRTPRSGWLQRGVALPESVADHSFGVAALAVLLAPHISEIDSGKLLALAIVHDIGESLLTDLPLSAQQLFGKEQKQSAERRAVEQLVAGQPNQGLVPLWEEYTAGASREARLVKALDRIDLYSQALAYERAGNRNLEEFWGGHALGWDEFPLLQELAVELAARRPVWPEPDVRTKNQEPRTNA
jgi:putative hydrolase of HD superfamily